MQRHSMFKPVKIVEDKALFLRALQTTNHSRPTGVWYARETLSFLLQEIQVAFCDGGLLICA